MPKYFRAPPKAIARPRDPAFNSINVDNNDYEEDRFQVSYQKQEDQDQDQQQGEYLRSRRQLRQCHRLATARCRAGWSCWFCVLYLRLLCFCVCFQAEQVCLAVFVFLFACVYLCCAGWCCCVCCVFVCVCRASWSCCVSCVCVCVFMLCRLEALAKEKQLKHEYPLFKVCRSSTSTSTSPTLTITSTGSPAV